jgi:hypothetical protein
MQKINDALENKHKSTYSQSKSLRMWRMKANESKSPQVTFTAYKDTCSPVYINDVQLPQEEIKYFRLHLYRDLPGTNISLQKGNN